MQNATDNGLKLFATFFLIYFNITYVPIEGYVGFGVPRIMVSAIADIVLLLYVFNMSKAMVLGIVYLTFQYISASFHPESWRWSTLLFSTTFVLNYICFYNLVTIKKVFTIDHFIRICKWVMMAFFVVCIIQQVLTIIGIRYLPIVNLMYFLDRGLGCQSLSLEPSHFARIMLVFYYAYVKCSEYKRGEGAFSLKELFSNEHKWVTIRFLWMMCTMGSGTAFFCLMLFSLYFVRKHNWYYVIPTLAICYSLLQAAGVEALDRATSTIEATSTLDVQTVRKTDSSASVRITPILNSLNADFTKFETWFGKGIDAGIKESDSKTMFDDYGFIFYILSLLLAFSCAYNFWSLGTLFMFAGVGGGCGTNIYYIWALTMVMTCVKYFHDNKDDPEIYEEKDCNIEDENAENKEDTTAEDSAQKGLLN